MDLTRELLEKNIELFAEAEELSGFCEQWLEEQLDLTQMFGFGDLNKKTKEIISKSTFGDPMAGALTDMPRLSVQEIKMRETRIKTELLARNLTEKELHERYRRNNLENFEKEFQRLVSSEIPSLADAFQGDYEKAIEECRHPEYGWNGQKVEFIISYMFIKGEFDLAERYVEKYVTREESIWQLDFVSLVEKSKDKNWKGQREHFERICKTTEHIQLNLMFIRGFLGVLPYDDYPWNEGWEFYR